MIDINEIAIGEVQLFSGRQPYPVYAMPGYKHRRFASKVFALFKCKKDSIDTSKWEAKVDYLYLTDIQIMIDDCLLENLEEDEYAVLISADNVSIYGNKKIS